MPNLSPEEIEEKITAIGVDSSSKKTKKRNLILGLATLLLILISLPGAVYLVQQRQDIGERAAEIVPTPTASWGIEPTPTPRFELLPLTPTPTPETETGISTPTPSPALGEPETTPTSTPSATITPTITPTVGPGTPTPAIPVTGISLPTIGLSATGILLLTLSLLLLL